MSDRYLKQVIAVRKDLTMPTGKLAAMVAHASMTFILKRFSEPRPLYSRGFSPLVQFSAIFSRDEEQWFSELDPGLEDIGQVSMAKIVCAVNSETELLDLSLAAAKAGLETHHVYDSGHSHNKAGDFACIAIGPAWPEQLEPVTGHLKVYR